MKKFFIFIIVVLGLMVAMFAAYVLIKWYPIRGHAELEEIQQYDADKIPVEPKDFRNDFEEIFELVKDRYPYTDEKHINFDSLHDIYLQRIDTMQSKVAYSLLIKEFFGNLKCAHADNVSIEEPWFIQGDQIIVIDNRVFVDKPSNSAIKAGLRDKDEIVSVDGVPVNKWVTDKSKYVSASTDAARYLYSAKNILWSYTDSVKRLDVIRQGKPLTLTIHLQSQYIPTKNKEQDVTWRKLSSQIGYIDVRSMVEGVDKQFSEALKSLNNLPYLIVDIRENTGGNSSVGDFIAQHLIKGERTIWNGTKLSPSADAYKGKVIVLEGPVTVSAAESFLITMKESGDAIVVGTPSAGDTGGNPRLFKTTYGMYYWIPICHPFKYSPKGFPLEGKGIKPHYLVPMKVNDFLLGKDTQLSYSGELIRK